VNRAFENYSILSNGDVVAHFSDGSSVQGIALVGADGINSRVRQLTHPNAKPR
jgi:2-polyprenyl-6-methoxyphenol hydroxylase-like FAD-dependent oxidoreductase